MADFQLDLYNQSQGFYRMNFSSLKNNSIQYNMVVMMLVPTNELARSTSTEAF